MAAVMNFAREETDPLTLPEGPRGPWAQGGKQHANPVEAVPVILWERPAKPAGWSAMWEVLPPPPPPPPGEDGVWIWVPEGEEAPLGGLVPHEGAFLPCAEVDEFPDLPGAPHDTFPQALSEGRRLGGITEHQAFPEPTKVQVPESDVRTSYPPTSGLQDAKDALAATMPDGPPWPVGTSPMSTLHWLENVQVPRNMTSGSQKDFGTHVGAHTGPSQVGGQMGPSQMDFVSQKGFGSQVGGGHTGPSSQVGGGQMDFGSHMGPSSQVGGGHMDFGSQKGFGSQVVGGQMGPGSHMNFDSQVSGGGGQSHAPTNPMGPSSQMHGHSGQMHPSQIQGRSQIGQMRTGSQISNPGAGGPCGPPRPGSQSGQANVSTEAPAQVWNPFPSESPAHEPTEQAWNPWASGDGDGPFWGSRSETPRRLIGDVGAFNSDDWRSRSALPSARSIPMSARSLQASSRNIDWTPSAPNVYGVDGDNFKDQSLESTSFWQVPPVMAAPSGRSASACAPAPQPFGSQAVGSGRGSFGVKQSSCSGSQALLTSTSDGLEVTCAVNQRSQGLRSGGAPPFSGFAGASPRPSHGCTAAAWPMPGAAGLGREAGGPLLDVTAYQDLPIPGKPDFDLLGPMRPASFNSRVQTWMNDPMLARRPVAQVAERNRHAAPILLDVTRGDRVYAPDD
ncbi:unnamed protein product [Effrenium voratum]|nr:unnamed protein product [Effrenium voratum]